MNIPYGSRAWYDPNKLWLTWYAKGRAAATRTQQSDSRYRPCSSWLSDQEAWRRGFADVIMQGGNDGR